MDIEVYYILSNYMLAYFPKLEKMCLYTLDFIKNNISSHQKRLIDVITCTNMILKALLFIFNSTYIYHVQRILRS